MTISSETNRSGPYSCNGATTSFPYGFKIYDQTHIRVILTNPAGIETDLSLGADYAVTGVGASGGGSVNLGSVYPVGYKITLLLNVPFRQDTDLENQGAYFAETIERSLDILTQQALQIKEQISRAFILPAHYASGVTIDPITLNDIAGNADLVRQYRDEAAAAAGAAADSAAVAALWDPSSYSTTAQIETMLTEFSSSFYLKNAFKSDGSANAPVLYGTTGKLTAKGFSASTRGTAANSEINIDVDTGNAGYISWSSGGSKLWWFSKETNDGFGLWNNNHSSWSFLIDKATDVTYFSAMPCVLGGNPISDYLTGNALATVNAKLSKDIGLGGVGIISPMYVASGGSGVGGSTIAGSNLRFLTSSGPAATGTWREIGGLGITANFTSLFQRIA